MSVWSCLTGRIYSDEKNVQKWVTISRAGTDGRGAPVMKRGFLRRPLWHYTP